MVLNNNAGYHCFYRINITIFNIININIINIADNSNLREITDEINFFLCLNYITFKI